MNRLEVLLADDHAIIREACATFWTIPTTCAARARPPTDTCCWRWFAHATGSC